MAAEKTSADCQAKIARTLDAIGRVTDRRLSEICGSMKDLLKLIDELDRRIKKLEEKP